jgi:membrane protease YdiL (CAAX protease family)
LRNANQRPGTRWRTIGLFLLLAIGWPWLVVPVFGMLGLLRIPGLAQMLIALLVMPAPAAAALVTSRVMHRRLTQDGLRLLGVNWRTVAVAPLAFVLFALLYLLLLHLLGNVGQLPDVGQLDVHGAAIVDNLRRLNPGLPTTAIQLPPDILLIPIFIGGALLVGVSINALFALGEELGWRGLLLTEIRSLGWWRANLLIGVAWGVWHAPLILFGGLNYPRHRVAGLGMMVLFCTAAGLILSYVRLRSRTLLAPSAFHGMINGIGSSYAVITMNANPLVGSVAGLVGIAALTLVALLLHVADRDYVRSFSRLPPWAATPERG